MKNIPLATTGVSPQVLTETLFTIAKSGRPFPDEAHVITTKSSKPALMNGLFRDGHLQSMLEEYSMPAIMLVNKYLYFVLCEGALVRDVMPETKGSVGQVNISLTRCRESKVPLPPVEEQKVIVRLVDQYFALADTIEAQVKKAQARVDNLTQSILAKAFRGELVAQDPNDEPADQLLARIAEALAKAAKKAEAAKKRAAKKST